jgi:hypothetical protein
VLTDDQVARLDRGRYDPQEAGMAAQEGSGREAGTLAAAFAAMGVTAATFPAALPSVAAFAGVEAERLLPGISLLFGALLVGVLVVSALHRSNPYTLLAAGCLLQAGALLGVGFSSSAGPFLLACAVAGLGFGLAEASANLLTRLLAADRTASSLAGMMAMTALAAAVCPVVLAVVATGRAGFLLTLVCLAVLQVAAALAAVLLRHRRMRTDEPAVRRKAGVHGLAVIAVGLFVFVGVETVLSGWSSVLPQRLLDLDPRTAAFGTSGFWILMTAGRFAARVIAARTGAVRHLVATLGLGAVALGVAAAFGNTDPRLSLVLAGIATVLLAPGYSLILGTALASVDAGAARWVTGVLVAIGSAGGSLIPLGVVFLAGARPAGSLAIAAALLLAAVLCALLHNVQAQRVTVARGQSEG